MNRDNIGDNEGAGRTNQEPVMTAQQLMQTFMQLRKLEWRHQSMEGYKKRDIMVLFSLKRFRAVGESGMKVSDISSRLQVTMPTITEQIKSLISDGVVERTVDVSDRRVVRITLTEKGEKLVSELEAKILEKWSGLIGYLGTEESWHLVELLKKMIYYFNELEGSNESPTDRCGDDKA
ncbi:MarR family transcriptional regulator [Paenibacillaceae bacterium]|nr:MarR family transcriptional regulator [Paenibacillaceae bacterium]